MTTLALGDYQTVKRMAEKLRAIPLPADLTGRTVLDVGCDHGAWCKLASDRGAASVLGLDRGRGVRQAGGIAHVDLVALNRTHKWDRCSFEYLNLGTEWTQFGKHDVVLCFSLYHHVYGETGDHDAIWRWLWQHTGDVLLWEGPVDTRDPIARDRAGRHGGYTRAAIMDAASRYFEVELVGPAIHRAHREVWRCTPREAPDDTRHGEIGHGTGTQGVPAGTNGDSEGAGRLVTDCWNAQRAGDGARRSRAVARRARLQDGARHADWPVEVVALPDHNGRNRRGRRPARARRKDADHVPGTGVSDSLPITGGAGRRFGVDPTRALILGGAHCVWDDVRALEAMLGHEWDGLVIAVNDVGCHWPRHIDHWCSLHAEKIDGWERLRGQRGFPVGYETWGSHAKRKTDRVIRAWGGGSSGLLAVTIAIAGLGCELVVLCGVPMDRTPHFKESTVHQKGRIWNAADGHWKAWRKPDVVKRMSGIVRSMSGRTMELLGAPDCEWLGCDGMPSRDIAA